MLELIAGKTRSNTAAAILSNSEDLKDALLAAQNAEGSALRENEKYLDSIQGKIDQFNNAVQSMWNNTLDSDVIKWLVNLGTQLIKIVDGLGLIRTAFIGITTYLMHKHDISFAKMLLGPKDVNIVLKSIDAIKNSFIDLKKIFSTQNQTELFEAPSPKEQTIESLNTQLEEFKAQTDEAFDNDKPEGFFASLSSSAKGAFKSSLGLFKDFGNFVATLSKDVAKSINNTYVKMTTKKGGVWTEGKDGWLKKVKQVKYKSVGDRKKTSSPSVQSTTPDAEQAINQIEEIEQSANRITNVFSRIKETIFGVATSIKTKFAEAGSSISQSFTTAFNKIKTLATNAINSVKAKFSNVATKSTGVDIPGYKEPLDYDKIFKQNAWQRHMNRLRDSARRVKEDVAAIWEHHNIRLQQSLEYAGRQFDKIKKAASQAFSGISKIITTVSTTIGQKFTSLSEKVRDIFGKIKQFGSDSFDAITKGASAITSGVKGAFEKAAKFIQQTFIKIAHSVTSAVKNVFNGALKLGNSAATAIKGAFIKIGDAIGNAFIVSFNKIKAGATSIARFVSNIANKALSGVVRIAHSAADGAKKAFNGVVGSIKNAFGKVSQIVKNAINATKPVFAQITQTIKNIANTTKLAFAKVGTSIGQSFSVAFQKVKGIIGNIVKSASQAFNNITLKANNAFVKATSKSYYDDGTGRLRKTKVTDGNRIDTTVQRDASVNNTRQAFDQLRQSVRDTLSSIADLASKVVDGVKNAFNKLPSKIRGVFDKIGKFGNKAFAGLKKGAAVATNGIKKVFNTIKTPITNLFKHVTNVASTTFGKIKKGASEAGKEFAKGLGYGQDKKQAEGSSAPSWYNAKITKQTSIADLGGDETIANQIQAINQAATQGAPALNQYMTNTKGMSDAMKAYVASLNGGQASLSGFNSFLEQNNAQLAQVPKLTFAAKLGQLGLAAATTVLNAAMSMGMSFLMQFIAEGLTKLVGLIKDVINPTEKWKEELSDLNSQISDTQSELNSLESELDNIRDRMAELLALPSLSFVEQEELDLLREQNAELERRQRLLKSQEERTKKEAAEKAADLVNRKMEKTSYAGNFWTGAGSILTGLGAGAGIGGGIGFGVGASIPIFGAIVAPIAAGVGAVIGGIAGGLTTGITEFAANRISEEEKVNEEIEGYQDLIDERRRLEGELAGLSKDDKDYEKKKKEIEKVNKKIDKKDEYIDGVLAELKTTLDGVEYGQGADEALDTYWNLAYKREISLGTVGAKSDGIAHIFSRAEHKAAKESLDDYIGSLAEGEEASREKIEGIIANNEALVADIQAMGLKISDAVDYFVMEASGFNTTPEGIMSQYQTAKQALEDLKNQKINIDDLVEYDADKNKATARVDEIAEHLKGVGPDIQKEFADIIEDIKEGTLEYEKAFKKLDIYSMQAMVNFAKSELESANKIAFPDLEISGWLDSVEELSGAFNSLATSMDLVATAQEQMNSSGRISLKTALDLMASTDQWNQILEVNNGVITMNANAEQILIQSKLDLIKANIEAAIADVETQITLMEGAINSQEAGNTFTKGFTNALIDCQGIMVGLKAGWDAFWSGQDVGQAFNQARNQALKTLKPTEQNLSSLHQQKAELEKKKAMLEGVDTTIEFKNNYDFDKKPGDKYGDDDTTKAKTGWEKLVSKYENELALITNERNLIEAEIDRMEAQGGKASTQYYKDLIANSTEEKDLLQEKYDALKAYLDANENAIDPETWTEYNNELNAIAVSIKECTTNLLGFYDALEELDIHYFEQAMDDVSRLGEEIEFVQSLLEDEDVADENGNWTSAGITRLGLYTTEMERAAASAAMYKQKINDVESSWAAYQGLLANATDDNGDGIIDVDDIPTEELDNLSDAYGYVITSEEEYKEKTDKLTDSMRSEIGAYNDAKDGVVELNEARIDAIKNGIEKEIEAYEDYIDAVKEALDAERDLYDFKNNIKKQTKDIASLERRIAALSGSTNAADIAERRKLEAELLEAKEGLNDTYYEHSRDAQSQALDEEAEAFSKSKEKYIEDLEATLDDVETLITNSIMDVLTNADVVLDGLNNIAEKYGITLSTELTTPWENAKNKPDEYWTSAKNAIQGYADFLTGEELGANFSQTITGFGTQIQSLVTYWNNVKAAAEAAHAEQERKVNVGGNPNVGEGNGSGNDGNGGGGGGGGATYNANVANLQTLLSVVFGEKLNVDGNYGPKTMEAVKRLQTKIGVASDGKYGEATSRALESYLKKMAKIAQDNDHPEAADIYKKYHRIVPSAVYAKGIVGTTKDQWALTDEIGDELVLVPGENGNLSFMRKGTSVVPADITSNLVEWGKLNPDMLNVANPTAGINMISNAVNKPELNITFDALVKAENITEETLPAVKKLVTQELNRFTKELNYALKGKGAR